MNLIIAIIIAIIAVVLTGGIGSIFSSKTTESQWYNCIKPSITPPKIAFPIIWTLLYILIAVALVLLMLNTSASHDLMVITLILIGLVLNVIWTFFYFNQKNVFLSLITIIILDLLVVAAIILASTLAIKLLLLPYLLWLSYATILTILSLSKEKDCKQYK